MTGERSSEEWAALAEAALAAAEGAPTGELRRRQLERAAIYAELAERARWPRAAIGPVPLAEEPE